MKSNLQQILATTALFLGLSTPAYSAKIMETDSYLSHARGYIGLNMVITEYDIVVKPDDNLSTIAEQLDVLHPGPSDGYHRHIPLTWQNVYRQNKERIDKPDVIHPGQKLHYSFAELAPGGLSILL